MKAILIKEVLSCSIIVRERSFICFLFWSCAILAIYSLFSGHMAVHYFCLWYRSNDFQWTFQWEESGIRLENQSCISMLECPIFMPRYRQCTLCFPGILWLCIIYYFCLWYRANDFQWTFQWEESRIRLEYQSCIGLMLECPIFIFVLRRFDSFDSNRLNYRYASQNNEMIIRASQVFQIFEFDNREIWSSSDRIKNTFPHHHLSPTVSIQ